MRSEYSCIAPALTSTSFSLRRLFLLVLLAAVGCWCATELRWLVQRRHVIDSHRGFWIDTNTVYPGPRAPSVLWLFGEPGYERITIKFDGPTRGTALTSDQQDELTRIRRLFPEAEVDGLVW
jgi:hypothetical protein